MIRYIYFIFLAYFLCACGSAKRDKAKLSEASYHYKLAYGHFFENKDGNAA